MLTKAAQIQKKCYNSIKAVCDFYTPLNNMAAIERQILRSSDISVYVSNTVQQHCTLKQCKQSDKKLCLRKLHQWLERTIILKKSSIPSEKSCRLCLLMSFIQA